MGSTAPNTPERMSKYMPENQPGAISTLKLPDTVLGQSFMDEGELATSAVQASVLGAPGTALATTTKKRRGDRSPASTGA